MSKPTLIFDLDNTIIDNSVRKHEIINKHLNLGSVTLEDVRNDFSLKSFLGEYDTVAFKKFFSELSSEKGIKHYKSELYPDSFDVLKDLHRVGFKLIILTSRPDKLRNATEQELKKHKILNLFSKIIMPTDPEFKLEDSLKFKFESIQNLMLNENILAIIGDRDSDIGAGIKAGIPTIFFESNKSEVNYSNPAGHSHCKNWKEIENEIFKVDEGNTQILELRSKLIDQYAKFLGDLDGKARINATFGIGLAALSARLLSDVEFTKEINFDTVLLFVQNSLIVFAFLLSILSIIFSINSMTSRYTSGFRSGKTISEKRKILLGYFWKTIFSNTDKFYLGEDDPRKEFDDLLNKKEEQQSVEHYKYFYEKYKTQNANALMNLRLFELRAANYSKVYEEIIASKFIKASVYLLFICVILGLLN